MLTDELLAMYTEILNKEGLTEDNSKKIAERLVRQFLYLTAGEQMYMPKKKLMEDKIKAEFTGNNHMHLARKFNLTMRRVYQILHK